MTVPERTGLEGLSVGAVPVSWIYQFLVVFGHNPIDGVIHADTLVPGYTAFDAGADIRIPDTGAAVGLTHVRVADLLYPCGFGIGKIGSIEKMASVSALEGTLVGLAVEFDIVSFNPRSGEGIGKIGRIEKMASDSVLSPALVVDEAVTVSLTEVFPTGEEVGFSKIKLGSPVAAERGVLVTADGANKGAVIVTTTSGSEFLDTVVVAAALDASVAGTGTTVT